jgi:CRISPR-associated protein Cas2
MPHSPINTSEFRTMWVLVLFDLPVSTKIDRRRYAKFRRRLLEKGFLKLQYSVYARPFETQESSETAQNAIIKEIPPLGSIRILLVTDRQFGLMKNFTGKKEAKNEPSYKQIMLF